MRPAFILIAALMTAVPAAAFAEEAPEPGLISIDGTGEVTAVPDMAIVNSGVTTDGPTAREALDANTAAMAALIEVLRAAGIEERDIQTSGFSVQPSYVYSDKVDEAGYQLPPRIEGYRVSNSVTVRVRDLTSLGTVLDRAVTVGANSINGISFTVAETDALMAEARRAAVADAISRAQLLTEAAGVGLGRIRSINEQGGAQPYVMQSARFDMVAAEAAPVPVAAGELTFSVTVSIQWEIAQ
ncbi:MAG: SIMPL domain-containing protein [Cucumibacter sp.]